MSHWKITPGEIVDGDGEYSAEFILTEVNRDQHVTIVMKQNFKDSAANLVGALRALAQLLVEVSCSDAELPETHIETLN